jgi:N-acetylglucosamine-6-phosphate deacetylase
MLVLSGATLVLPDRLMSPGTLVIDGDRIVEIRSGGPDRPDGSGLPLHGHVIVPGFIDVHVHGVSGTDALDGDDAIARMAAELPRFGVTAFCPTSVACEPPALRRLLVQVERARVDRDSGSARVLPAHLESNFINPDYRGAQPLACLRSAREALDRFGEPRGPSGSDRHAFDGDDILREIVRSAPDVGIVTVAPEVDGALDLIGFLVARGLRVSLGHSSASYDEAMAAVAAGARQATHLFNRMPPISHRAPGLAGAVLQTDDLAAEIIGDAVHVHPAMVRAVVAAKRPSRVLAITDATAAAALPEGSRTRLGGQVIVAGPTAAHLDDGTLAGGTTTMDGIFRTLVNRIGLSLVDSAVMCSTTPARELGLVGHGVLAVDAVADFTVLDATLSIVQTYVGGCLVHSR